LIPRIRKEKINRKKNKKKKKTKPKPRSLQMIKSPRNLRLKRRKKALS